MSTKTIYLDYASTYPRVADILSAREQFERTSYANVGRGNYDLADKAIAAYMYSKKVVSEWIGCHPVEVLYTYSATYALNILALALEHNKVITAGDTILLSISEHHANIVPWQMLAERVGAKVRFVKLGSDYALDLHDLKKQLDDSVKVVSLQYASNVTGALHPLEKVRELIGDRLFFVDAAQMVPHGPISMSAIGCDALVFSGHKMMADTGIGVLALARSWQKAWQAPLSGGGAISLVSEDGFEQAGIPERWEPGTPHITGAITLSAAVKYIQENSPSFQENYQDMCVFSEENFGLLEKRGLHVFHAPQGLGIWSFSISGKHPHDVADIFSEHEICLRSGHHCCEPLHHHFGLPGTVRMSIGFHTTKQELTQFFAVLSSLL